MLNMQSVEQRQETETKPRWDEVLVDLQGKVTPHNFEAWLKPITFVGLDNDTIMLEVPNRFARDWIANNYLPLIEEALRSRSERRVHVMLRVNGRTPTTAMPPAVELPRETKEDAPAPRSVKDHDSPRLNPKYTFDSFIVGPSNQLAHAASQAVTKMIGRKYNPLFVYGGVGLGKTHLVHAIGNELLRNHNLNLFYLTSEGFTNEYITCIQHHRMEEFRHKYRRSCDVLLVDDIQFIAGKDGTQDEFFHTFNALYDQHKQIVLTSDKYPQEIPDLEERLRSRFQWGLIADIQAPEMETRVAILKKKADVEGIHLPDEVAFFIADHIRSNVRELEGCLIRLAAKASLAQRPIDVQFTQEVLKKIITGRQRKVTIEDIQQAISGYFNVTISDLVGSKRQRTISHARQVAMFLCRKCLSASFPEIGERFGGKDHSTVISAFRKIENLAEKDMSVRSTIQVLERRLGL